MSLICAEHSISVSGTWLAKTCVLMGRKEEAFHLLEVDYARHQTEVLSCLSDPDLLTLKDDPDTRPWWQRFVSPCGLQFPIRTFHTEPKIRVWP